MATSVGLVQGESRLGKAAVGSKSSSARVELSPMALCLLVALTPLAFAAPLFEPYVGAKEVLVQAGAATVALVWILSVKRESWTLTLTPAWIPVVGLAVIGATSVLWSSNASVSLAEGQRLVAYFLLFAVALQAMRRAESRAMLATALVLAGSIEAVYVLLQYTFGDPIFLTGRLQGKWQTFGTLGNPNWTGEFLAVTALVSLGRLTDVGKTIAQDLECGGSDAALDSFAPLRPGVRKSFTQRRNDRKEPRDNPKRRRRYDHPSAAAALGTPVALPAHSKRHWTLVALILMLLALAATLARAAWLAFIIGATAFLVLRHARLGLTVNTDDEPETSEGQYHPRERVGAINRPAAHAGGTDLLRHLRLNQHVLPLTITGVAGVLLVVMPLLTKREAVGHLLNLKSVRGRIWMWAVTGTMIRDAPWRGHGLDTFGLRFPFYQARAFSREWAAAFIPNASFTSYAHNDYLQLWAELGLFGLLAFVALVWVVLKRGRRLASDPIALGFWAAVISLLVNAAVAFPLHLPATLTLLGVLAGGIEATVSRKAVGKTSGLSKPAIALRVAIVLPLLILCLLAYKSSYNLLVAEAALSRADAALGNRQWHEAETPIRTAIRHAPTRPEGWAMLGRLHLERGEEQDALSALDQAMKLGFDVDVYEMKATALERTGQRAAAIATLKELVWLRPDLTWPRERLSSFNEADDNHGEGQR